MKERASASGGPAMYADEGSGGAREVGGLPVPGLPVACIPAPWASGSDRDDGATGGGPVDHVCAVIPSRTDQHHPSIGGIMKGLLQLQVLVATLAYVLVVRRKLTNAGSRDGYDMPCINLYHTCSAQTSA